MQDISLGMSLALKEVQLSSFFGNMIFSGSQCVIYSLHKHVFLRLWSFVRDTRCLFKTQQNKERLTKLISLQSELVLTATPIVGDRLWGALPMLI